MMVLGVLLVMAEASIGMEPTKLAADKVSELLAVAATATSCDAQQTAFNDIENLGCAAVPNLATFAGDRRPLSCARMQLRNKSREAFEGRRHYSPTLVGDAVQALLNQLTGQHFGPVYNGSTEQELNASAAQWRAFVAKTPIGDLCRAWTAP
ncbi:MAG: hypothetical protein ACRERC_06780 [Candidatus Binatia bacterium]